MFKKPSAAVKKANCLFRRFFVKNECKIAPKTRKTTLCAKINKGLTFGTPFFSKKNGVCLSCGVPLGRRRPPRTSREPSRIFNCFINYQLRLKTGPDPSLGGPREAPDVPQAPPGHHFGSILDRLCISKNIQKC